MRFFLNEDKNYYTILDGFRNKFLMGTSHETIVKIILVVITHNATILTELDTMSI